MLNNRFGWVKKEGNESLKLSPPEKKVDLSAMHNHRIASIFSLNT